MNRSFKQIAFALLLTLGVSTTFAAVKNTTDNGNATTSFHKDFKHAEVLSTEPGTDYTKITFKMNGAVLIAFYSENGELLAITHNIRPTELPLNLLMQVKNNYADCWITDCFEFDANGSTSYYITLENADTKFVLRSNDAQQWETYSKTDKN